MRKTTAYLLAVLASYLLGVVLVSQFNIARITALGHPVTLSDRLHTVLHDWGGMLGTYLPLIAIALMIAFLFTGLFLARFIGRSAGLYALAGFVGLISLHQIMLLVLGVNGIAAVRSLAGLLAQACAGGVGGYLFYRYAFKISTAS